MRFISVFLWLCAVVNAAPVAAVDIEMYVKPDRFNSVKISPTGDYLAASVTSNDTTALVVLRRSDNKVLTNVVGPNRSVIFDYWWVNEERVVVAMAERRGKLETPFFNGDLHAVNADGSSRMVLTKVDDSEFWLHNWPFAVYPLKDQSRYVYLAVESHGKEPKTFIERVDVYNARHTTIVTSPVRRADFVMDTNNEVRFAQGLTVKNESELYYRNANDDKWQRVNAQQETGLVQLAMGFSADNKFAYLESEQTSGPSHILSFDVDTHKTALIASDEFVDPYRLIFDPRTNAAIGSVFFDEQFHFQFFAENVAQASVYQTLQRVFKGNNVYVASSTKDGNQHVVEVFSDKNPGDIYLFNSQKKTADLIFSRFEQFDPAVAAVTKSVRIVARDKTILPSFITVPLATTTPVPFVVIPHGGPFGIFDTPAFSRESQLLVSMGIGVLRVNFRGSGNYGRAFEVAGAGQWGLTMQDDITDVTKWLIEQKWADPKRIAIYGASYGGYAALMAVAREPELYACAIGLAGVYDLPRHVEYKSNYSESLKHWANDWIGEVDKLASVSPVNLVDNITVPVLLAAGLEDKNVLVEQSELMEEQLKRKNREVKSLYFKGEGHGLSNEKNQAEFYRQMIDFLNKHLLAERNK